MRTHLVYDALPTSAAATRLLRALLIGVTSGCRIRILCDERSCCAQAGAYTVHLRRRIVPCGAVRQPGKIIFPRVASVVISLSVLPGCTIDVTTTRQFPLRSNGERGVTGIVRLLRVLHWN
jgi:hypothetical protein